MRDLFKEKNSFIGINTEGNYFLHASSNTIFLWENKMTDNKFNGKWKIVEMGTWNQKYVDLIEPGYIEFGDKKYGSLHFGCIYADIEYSVSSDNKAVFSFQGDDEGHAISGRGWVKIKNNDLHGRIFIHNGDDSSFNAKLIGVTA